MRNKATQFLSYIWIGEDYDIYKQGLITQDNCTIFLPPYPYSLWWKQIKINMYLFLFVRAVWVVCVCGWVGGGVVTKISYV
jgi:hypothetical protein